MGGAEEEEVEDLMATLMATSTLMHHRVLSDLTRFHVLQGSARVWQYRRSAQLRRCQSWHKLSCPINTFSNSIPIGGTFTHICSKLTSGISGHHKTNVLLTLCESSHPRLLAKLAEEIGRDAWHDAAHDRRISVHNGRLLLSQDPMARRWQDRARQAQLRLRARRLAFFTREGGPAGGNTVQSQLDRHDQVAEQRIDQVVRSRMSEAHQHVLCLILLKAIQGSIFLRGILASFHSEAP